MRENEHTVSPPGVMATLSAGFDLTAKHLWLVLLPVALDLFYWLGPRLSFQQLVEQLVSFWQQETLLMGIDADMLLELAPRTNLFTSLSLPVIGVPAFVVGLVPERTPFPTQIVELESFWTWALHRPPFLVLAAAYCPRGLVFVHPAGVIHTAGVAQLPVVSDECCLGLCNDHDHANVCYLAVVLSEPGSAWADLTPASILASGA
jgi:hypothetical protein